VSELELPALPLGQGPPRIFRELTLKLAPGASLALCSDGLYEAMDWSEAPYGFDRPREVLFTMRHRPAAEILSALLADQRRHLALREAADDTTIVVRRQAGREHAHAGGGPAAAVTSRSEVA
jgi:serine phosphatase RsbU (regulator of sigma subunit)